MKRIMAFFLAIVLMCNSVTVNAATSEEVALQEVETELVEMLEEISETELEEADAVEEVIEVETEATEAVEEVTEAESEVAEVVEEVTEAESEVMEVVEGAIVLASTTATYEDPNGAYTLSLTIDSGVAQVTGFTVVGTPETIALVIPATVNVEEAAVPVTSIATSVFSGQTAITSVQFAEGSQLTTIGRQAFANCSALSYVEFPDSVTEIGYRAFYNNILLGTKAADGSEKSVPEVELPSNLATIGTGAFELCTSIEKIVIPLSLNEVTKYNLNHYGPFHKCYSLTDVRFEEGRTSIPAHLFSKNIVPTADDVKLDATLTVGTMSFVIPSTVTEIGEAAFRNQTNMVSVTFEEGSQLTTIGAEAFSNCQSLCNIELPDTVTEIKYRAFYNNILLGTKAADGSEKSVPEVELPSNLATIGTGAFELCTSIEKVTIPLSLNEVKKYNLNHYGPFHKCYNLTDIRFEEGRTSIPAHLFSKNIVPTEDDVKADATLAVGTISFVIPSTVTEIGEAAFRNQTNMVSVVFEEGSRLTTIGVEAFCNCQSLCNIEFPDTVTEIKYRAFYNNILLGTKAADGSEKSVPEVELPSNLATIGTGAFELCTSIEKIVIPLSLNEVKKYNLNHYGPFHKCYSLTDIRFEEGKTSIPAHLFSKNIVPTADDVESDATLTVGTISFVIPSTVTEIGEAAFRNQTNMVSVTFEEGSQLTTIGVEAFCNCQSLCNIEIPDAVKEIGYRAFYNGILLGTKAADGSEKSVPEVELPSGLETLGTGAFELCTSIEKMVIPASLNVVKKHNLNHYGPFYNCSNLTEIILEDGRTTIPTALFWKTITAEPTLRVVIPDSVTAINEKEFSGNTSLKEFIVGDNSELVTIGKSAFNGCADLIAFNFTEKLTTIGESAFYGCAALEAASFPESVSTIGKTAFYGCSSLKSVEFEVNNFYTKEQTLGESVFNGCAALETVKLGNKITAIPTSAFSGCSALTELEIPYGVTSIGENAFYNCNALRILFIPASVTTINTVGTEFAFTYEQQLKVYVEKGDSAAKTFAEENEFPAEVGIYVTADEFPDKNLWAQMNTQRYDLNLDTRLTLRELEKIVNVDLSGLEIADMTGTQLFTSMESLDCSDNKITVLDTSAWPLLNKLDCSGNELTDLDISKNVVEVLDCSDNHILIFNLSDIETLTSVALGNQTGVMAIEHDTVYDEYILPIDKAYPIYDKVNVVAIGDEDAKKPSNEGIVWLAAYDVPDVVTYRYTTGFGSGELSAEANVTVEITNAGIELTATEYPDAYLRTKINEIIDFNKNGLISKTEERACVRLDVSNANIQKMDGIERLVNLEELVCKDNNLAAIDVSKNLKLTKLDCTNNQIKVLDLSTNTALVELLCANNKLSKLDLSANTLLEKVECGDNRLAAIDVSQNTKLDTLRGGSQELTLERETYGEKSYVKVINNNAAFNSANVSDVKIYVGSTAYAEEKYYQITEEGFIVDSFVDKITYSYSLGEDFRAMNVTINIVSNLEEEIEEKDINDESIVIDKFSNKPYTGEAVVQNIVIMDGRYMLREDRDYTVTYTDNIEAGTATVMIKGMGNYCGSYSDTFEIIPEWNITVKAIKDQTFQHQAIEPKLTVKEGKVSLKADIDYKAEYINNFNTGVATVVITGIGAYADRGVKEVTFNIVECQIKKATFSIGEVTYNGQAQEPALTVVHNGYLVEGKDYEVSYSKNIKAGKGTVTIVGIGNYSGKVNKTFKINKIDLSKLASEDIIVESQAEFSMIGAKAAVTVKYGDLTLIEGTDYTLSYSKNKAIGTAQVTIKGKGSCTGKVVKTFEVIAQDIKDASVTVTIDIAQKDKNGKAIKPKIKVVQDKKTLREGEKKDYIVSYDEAATTTSGVVKVTILGKGNYKGDVVADFIIVDTLINKAKVTGLKKYEYDGSEREQLEEDVVVKVGKEEVPAYCYDLSYQNNVNVGKALMTVTADPARCNYEFGGSVTTKFDITAVKFKPSKDVERVSAKLFADTYVYAGGAICPEEIVYDNVLGTTLEKDVDYTVTYKNNAKVNNKGSVTIKGKGNYSGAVTLPFTVVAKDMSISGKDFDVFVKNSAYTGKKITPKITVMDNGTVLNLNKDYKLSIEQAVESEDFKGTIIDKGKYIITIEGMGNYSGQLEEDYYLYVY